MNSNIYKKERPTIDDVAQLLRNEGKRVYAYSGGTNLLTNCVLPYNHKNNDKKPSLYLWEADPVKKYVCIRCHVCEYKDVAAWFTERIPNLLKGWRTKKSNKYSYKRKISSENKHDLNREIGKKNRHEYI